MHLRIDGLRFLFRSIEGGPRGPPSIHVLRDRDETRFRLRPEVSPVCGADLGTRRPDRTWKPVERNREKLQDALHDHFAWGFSLRCRPHVG